MYTQSETTLAKSSEKTSPISVILVSSGSRGNKLLFRYPFQKAAESRSSQTNKQRNPYALNTVADLPEDQDGDSREQTPLTDEQLVAGFSDIILATILATKSDMCGKKFELKIDNVRFVGHPTLLQHTHTLQVSKTDPSPKREIPTMILFNVVFALRANADPSVISCMHNLSRRVAIALQHEERRCQYLTREAKLMLALQDEATAMAEDGGLQSPFWQILPKCKLAQDLKEAYDSLCTTGAVRLHINNWLEVSFCLPHKIHRVGGNHIPPEALERSLKAIRPYHALLLLDSERALLSQLPLDCSPALVRVIKTCSAVKNLQQLAQDADLALLQVFQLAAHLVYWGKAIIIYPLCENNVYMLSPHANICLYSPLAEHFAQQFPGHDLPSMLAKFSLPVSLSEFRNPLDPPVEEANLIQMVIWMLQHRLLIQLHTYVCLLVPPSEEEQRPRDEELPLAARVGGRSLSTPSALSFGSPTSSDDMTLTSPSMDNSSAELAPGGDSPLNKRMTETLLASLTEHERQVILSIPAAQSPEDLRMFARLLHYFRGRHHLEEIMYNENMRRSQLKTLFDKFRSVLVVTNHEDPIISLFQSPLD
ncbi:GATOR1 complex protein NPRL3 isoform X2 [Lepisosteus oculatus]|uniref:GATOR1 complex protein NPRL3 isoform X2 n=1 Tax=Lepisosteus oculatus TaxID=7918 RepID=UPI000740563A|nr:PREDICTED: nitrogen permease regulator 3-like protein isoform X2 [Lepisosteus oculatus]